MLILFSAFNPRVPMNKAGIKSSCHGESRSCPSSVFGLGGSSQQTLSGQVGKAVK